MARRVIVTDVHDRAGLGACRSLRSSGFLVTGVASAHPAPGHWSRSCSERFALVDPRRDPADDFEGIVRRVGTPFLVQRAEEGDQYSVAGVIAEGQLIVSAVSRYIRTWPVKTGRAAFSETVIPPNGLVGRVERLVREFGWQGIFELELIRRPDGSFAAIDFNPRLYGSIVLAESAGASIPTAWCEWLLGLKPKPVAVSARPGLRYRSEDADLRHGLWQIRRGN